MTDTPVPIRPATQVKVPKGTRDCAGKQVLLREHVFKLATEIFERHGGIPLDTPVFELRDILSEKYGEDSKLIYDLADQGGEICSLRYDLTVPFARWLAMHANRKNIKRYHIAKVYRRDQPAMSRGRFREFYQCDFDIAGEYDPMIPDAEILRIVVEVLAALEIDVTIKLNHRQILDGMFATAGVPEDKTRAISSAVDKLDKAPWDEVKKEMEEKGLSGEVADRIGEYVRRSGDMRTMLDFLNSDATLCANSKVKSGIDDMSMLLSYLEALEVLDHVSFDLSLARGLDYYSGLIYEVIPKNTDPVRVGSIAAGGRYDDLVGMYSRTKIPCVGVSFGVDRILTILEARRGKDAKDNFEAQTDVYVMAFGGKGFNGLLLERMAIARKLWAAGFRTRFTPKVKPKPLQQWAASENVPVAVILGEDEVAAGQVRLKAIQPGEGAVEKDKGRLVSNDDLIEEVRKLISETTRTSTNQ